MYKKITHTIVEEHFAHPVGVDIATHLDSTSPIRLRKRIPTAADIMTEDAFRAAIDNYFISLESKLINLANATYDPNLDFQKAIGDAMDVEGLGTMLGKYYDIEFKERLSHQLHNLVMSTMFTWRNASRSLDNTDTLRRLRELAQYFALFLNQYNNFWDSNTAKTTLNNLITEFINLGAAKKAKNTANETKAKDAIAANMADLSNFMAAGVLQQHPDFFTKA